MRATLISSDLLTISRLESAAARAQHALETIADPGRLTLDGEQSHLILVDWGARQASWGTELQRLIAGAPSAARVILFGPHRDLTAHAEARAAGLGPMMARSKVFADLPSLLERGS